MELVAISRLWQEEEEEEEEEEENEEEFWGSRCVCGEGRGGSFMYAYVLSTVQQG